MIQDLIISQRIPLAAVLRGDVTHVIRLAQRKHWSAGSNFWLKTSHRAEKSIKVRIVYASVYSAQDIPDYILNRSYYKNQDEFRTRWENWGQSWTAPAWVVKFKVEHKELLKNEN